MKKWFGICLMALSLVLSACGGGGGGGITLDIFRHFAIIPTDFRSPIALAQEEGNETET
jgi:hypothetical protein